MKSCWLPADTVSNPGAGSLVSPVIGTAGGSSTDATSVVEQAASVKSAAAAIRRLIYDDTAGIRVIFLIRPLPGWPDRRVGPGRQYAAGPARRCRWDNAGRDRWRLH